MLATAPRDSSHARREAWRNFLASGTTGAIAMSLTNPLDVLKARWQVMPAGGAGGNGAGGGLLAVTRTIVAREGLWNGLWRHALLTNMAACTCSVGFRIGTYPLIRDSLQQRRNAWAGEDDGDGGGGGAAAAKDGGVMWLSGLLSGCAGYFLGSPLFLAKTRLQAEAGLVGPDGRYATGARAGHAPSFGQGQGAGLRALRGIAAERGAAALWSGAGAFTMRGAVLSSSQLASYDWVKTEAKRRGLLADGPALHVLASLVASLTLTTCVMPLDVTVTRYQAGQGGVGGRRHATPLACAAAMLREEGPAVFMRGWSAMFARMAPSSVLTFYLYAQVRGLLGLAYMD